MIYHSCDLITGLSCNDCQENLFKRIQQGEFDFPEPEWKNVSKEAKDLICHLLVSFFSLLNCHYFAT